MRILIVGLLFALTACVQPAEEAPAQTHVCTTLPTNLVECAETG
ncbi:hypothetical protein [Frigidibacter albus]|nr:hypothetical protein [Frigidibacter albus]